MTPPSPSDTLNAIKANARKRAIESDWADLGIDHAQALTELAAGKTIALAHEDGDQGIALVFRDGTAIRIGYRVTYDSDWLTTAEWVAT